MSRYIDADKLTEAFVKAAKKVGNIGDQIAFRMMINEIPVADVIEVVRCKDCKYQNRVWHEDKRFQDDGYYMVSCKRNDDPFVMHTVDGYDNDFCSYGERKDT